jgi:hypothetical protein
MFVGYDGTLASHAVPYQPRKNLIENLADLRFCPEKDFVHYGSRDVCPEYLLWTEREKSMWKMDAPEPANLFAPAIGNLLYRIKYERAQKDPQHP